jgi:pro-kumamolisin-like protein/Big-like domain-containing protein
LCANLCGRAPFAVSLLGCFMAIRWPSLSRIALLFFLVLASQSQNSIARPQSAIVPDRITQLVDSQHTVILPGNTHPLARAEYDHGLVADSQPLSRMLLLLQRSPQQDAALQQLLEDQQNKLSPGYHRWLTPEQFGAAYGPSDADLKAITNWLASRGFTQVRVGAGRTVIEFSGNVGQVRNAFHAEMHRYILNGQEHIANSSDPRIPAALAPVVAGIVSLHDFRPAAHIKPVGSFHKSNSGAVTPLFTPIGSTQFFPLAPADFGKIYNVAPLWSAGITGTGQSIAVVGESNIKLQDVIDFRTLVGLPQNFSAQNVILNGTDPGVNGTETESDLDVQWAGAIAPGATIDFVTSAPTETTSGIHLSALYAVDNNVAGVISESFGICEQDLGAAGNQFYNSLWQQASAQGITVVLSSGDGGSAGCDNFDVPQPAIQGLAVSGFASTPYNVAVGGTDFDQFNKWSQYWSTTNDPVTRASVLSYIPEIPWNDSCAQLGLTGCGPSAPGGSINIVAGSGGPSLIYPKPSWQSGVGVPADGKRDIPDISLFASNGFTGSLYIICNTDSTGAANCTLDSFGFTFQGVGGTSASAPAFAGIMALVNQKQSSAQNPAPRQGNANYVLYKLAQKQAAATPALNCNSSTLPNAGCTFNDITKGDSALPGGSTGTNSVPCAGRSPNCSSLVANASGVLVTPANKNILAWTTSAGYDLPTGLGSVNAQNLVNNWGSITFSPSATTLTVNGATTGVSGLSHGTSVSVASTVSAASGGTGTPSGQIALLATPNPTPGTPGSSMGVETLTLTTGSASNSGVILPGGSYSLSAHYQGDGTFGPSDSTPAIPINIAAESSKTFISVPVFDPTTGRETTNTPTTLVYGSPYIARVDVGNANATPSFPPVPLCTPPSCPTGAITWTDSFNGAPAAPLDGGTLALNTAGFADDLVIQLSGGSHLLSASYGGDNSYGASSATPYALTITPASTQTQLPFIPPNPIVGQPISFTVFTQELVPFGAPLTGTFTILDGGTPLPATVTTNFIQGAGILNGFVSTALSVGGQHTITAKYNGDVNYAASTSSPLIVNALYGTTVNVSVTPTTVNYGDAVSVNVTVTTPIAASNAALKPTGNLTIPVIGNTPLTSTVMAAANGNWEIQASTTFVPQQTEGVVAFYQGDANYAFSSGSTVVVVNIPDFAVAVSDISVTAGQTGTAAVTITPATNLSSPVTLGCFFGFTIPGTTCQFNPATVNLSNGQPVVASMSLTTLPPSGSVTSAAVVPQPGYQSASLLPLHRGTWWFISFLSGFVSFLLLRLPGGRRRFSAALSLGLVCLVTFMIGCGGGGGTTGISGGGGGSGGGGAGGPVPTNVTVTTSSVKVPLGTMITFTATVKSSKPVTGNVFFNDATANFASNNNVGTDGTAQTSTSFLIVGTHVISAQYQGDANNLPSQSGNLNVVVTGTTTQPITGATSILTHLVQVHVTIQ